MAKLNRLITKCVQVFRRLWLNFSVHLDYFKDVFINFMISFSGNNLMEKQSLFSLKKIPLHVLKITWLFVFGWTKPIMLQREKSMLEMSWKWKGKMPCRTVPWICSWTSWCSYAQIKKVNGEGSPSKFWPSSFRVQRKLFMKKKKLRKNRPYKTTSP